MKTATAAVNNTQLAKDLEFLLSFVPATSVDQVIPGLFPTAYVTQTYEGDVKLVRGIEEIMIRYQISEKEIDDAPDVCSGKID